MRRKGFDCRRCGHCCLHLVDAYRGCVSDEDLARWQAAGRDDLLAWIDTLDLGHGNRLHLAWIDPQSKEEVDRCPWLLETAEGYGCGIYEQRPDYCRNYPENVKHAEGSGCPGFNKKESSPAGAAPDRSDRSDRSDRPDRPLSTRPCISTIEKLK